MATLTLTIRSDDISCENVLVHDLKSVVLEGLTIYPEDKGKRVFVIAGILFMVLLFSGGVTVGICF